MTKFDVLVVEGLVIVISILLAFSIDAWWDQKRETRDAEDPVARVSAELRADIQSTENSSIELRQMRPAILDRMHTFVSGLDIVKGHPLMAD